jgi:hypothetical protein
MMVKDFKVDGRPLLQMTLTQPNLAHDKDDAEEAEYVIGVDWEKSVPLNEAKSFDGIFANQNVVCRLREPRTIEFLKQAFSVDI